MALKCYQNSINDQQLIYFVFNRCAVVSIVSEPTHMKEAKLFFDLIQFYGNCNNAKSFEIVKPIIEKI